MIDEDGRAIYGAAVSVLAGFIILLGVYFMTLVAGEIQKRGRVETRAACVELGADPDHCQQLVGKVE